MGERWWSLPYTGTPRPITQVKRVDTVSKVAKTKTKKETSSQNGLSISTAFLENESFIKKFLARFFYEPQDIEDVAQEACLRAYVAEQSKHIEQPKAFLFRVAKNIALNKLGKKSQQITDYIEDLGGSDVIQGTSNVADEVEAEQALGLYCEAVATLPDKCRQVFLLRKVHGLTHKKIAQRMSLSVSSVEKYLLKGVLACRDFIDKRENGVLSQSNESSARSVQLEDK